MEKIKRAKAIVWTAATLLYLGLFYLAHWLTAVKRSQGLSVLMIFVLIIYPAIAYGVIRTAFEKMEQSK